MKQKPCQIIAIFLLITIYQLLFTPSPAFAEEELFFIHSDHLGSTSLVSNENGELVSQQNYYPYGSTRNSSEKSLPTERQYTGQVSDIGQIGLYYYNARYYDPTAALFTQADSQEGPNRYAYVLGNPAKMIDPSGEQSTSPLIRGATGKESGAERLYLPVVYKESGHGSSFFTNLVEEQRREDFRFDFVIGGGFSGIDSQKDQIFELSRFVRRSGAFKYGLPAYTRPIMSALRHYQNKGVITEDDVQKTRNLLLAFAIKFDQKSLKSLSWEELTPEQRYEQDAFVCYNFTDQLSAYIQEYVPEVPVYAAGAPTHAFVLVELRGEFYLTDPTPGGIFGNQLVSLKESMINHPEIDWLSLGYNPEASSPLASRVRFLDYVQQALIETGQLSPP
ncbi:RHS repeat domain-containing protein [Patescibacteria group bacterium]